MGIQGCQEIGWRSAYQNLRATLLHDVHSSGEKKINRFLGKVLRLRDGEHVLNFTLGDCFEPALVCY